MEAFLAFDPHNQPFLIDYNCRFLDVIARIAFKHNIVTCASREAVRKLLSQAEDIELLTNVLILIFAPAVASLRVIGQHETPSNLLTDSVPTARISFSRYMDHVFLHVSDAVTCGPGVRHTDRTVTKERSLYYFVELMKLGFGSNPMSGRHDESQRSLVLSLHRWWLSSSASPPYLSEAMDRLLVSANLKATLSLILQTILAKSQLFLKLYGEVPSQALLYVNGKYTCDFSNQSSNRLSNKDLILMQLLVECKCMPGSQSPASATTANISSREGEDAEVCYFGDTESETDDGSENWSRTGSRAGETVLNSFGENMTPMSVKSATSFLLFLQRSKSSDSVRLPVGVRIVKVTDAIVVILISELSTRFQAKSIHSVIMTLTRAVYARHEFSGFEDLNDFDKSCSHLKKILERSHTRSSKQLILRLTQLHQQDIRKYCSSFSKTEMPVKVDALSSAVCSALRSHYHENVYLFEKRRMQKVSEMDQVSWHLMSMQSFAQEQMTLYIEYLEVKSKISMSIEPYAHLVPGLKGFLYVDRKINAVVYAIADQKTREAVTPAVANAYLNLKSGKLSSSFQASELSAHYFMWFENMRGHTMKPKDGNLALTHFPCLMRSDFVSQIATQFTSCRKRESLCCWNRERVSGYEILVLCKNQRRAGPVVKSLSSQATLDVDLEAKCKRLANKLYEFIAPEHFVSTLF